MMPGRKSSVELNTTGSKDSALSTPRHDLPVSSATQLLANSSGVQNIQEYHERLVRRVNELENEVRIMKSAHNAVLPICRLPAEILSSIFILVYPGFHANRSLPYCFVLSHVCWHWKTVALGCSAIWADLDHTVRPTLAGLMLRRSRNAPLTIQYWFPDRRHERLIRTILSQTPRLHQIRIVDSFDGAFDLVEAFSEFGGYAPSLHTLHIQRDTKMRKDEFPDIFLAGGAPFLRILELCNCNIPWGRMPFSSCLTVLRLRDEPSNSRNRPSPNGFLGVLRSLTSLKQLELRGYLPEDESQPLQAPVTLPVLETFLLQDSIHAIRCFLRSVQVPHTANPMLYITDHLDDVLTVGLLFSDFKSALKSFDLNSRAQPVSPVVRQLQFDTDIHDFGNGIMKFMTMDVWLETGYAPPPKPVKFVGNFLPLADVFLTVREQFDLSRLQELGIEDFSELQVTDWTNSFGDLARLHTVKVGTESEVRNLLGAMNKTIPRGSLLAPRSSHYFPALTYIELHGMDFNRGEPRANIIACIIDNLKQRSKTQPVRQLLVNRCRNFKHHHHELLDNAEIPGLTLLWDRYEDSDSDSELEEEYAEGSDHDWHTP
ncbi:hypothetical protein DFP72DRAFT_945797 [Ephemerocybe angulata]|uniref:F-box domain-containing protein n=1 Tax=Ephemerocybe angulata TaxID=980116 RepID=A0A8H6H8P9_9AGAR|nr:hypothetical protein DFP72DRAFT_945797 [Tulosesus angulatus]